MDLILPFPISPSLEKISYSDKIMLIGSCFTEEIGYRMKELKFNVLQNPNGILYDPLSISYALNSCIENKKFNEEDLFLLNELWHSWKHHSLFSGPDKEKVLQRINHAQSSANIFLKETSWLVITVGTSYCYFLKSSGDPVANCHKAPSAKFEKKLLETDRIITALSKAIYTLQEFNRYIKIILTVSPVRHIRDGIIENNRSKSRLIEAVHFIKNSFQNVSYFPAYELIIDVLRDYRFFKDDLVHPSETTTSYVFEKFCATYLDDTSIKLLKEIQDVSTARKHKPFQEESISHKKFKKIQLEKINKLSLQFPFLDLSDEKKYFS